MATAVIGLKTHIWNNNLKSFLFLLFYPIVITPLYIVVVIVGLSTLTTKHWQKSHDLTSILYQIIFDYWYVPYAVVLVFLYFVYRNNLSRLDIDEGKKLVKRETHPELYALLENLCISRGLNMPYFFIKKNNVPNAYTSGLSEQTFHIVVTTGLLEKLDKDEIEAVIAHELTHIINRDTRLIFLTGTVTHILSQISLFLKPEKEQDYDDSGFLSRPRYGKGYAQLLLLSYIFKLGNLGSLFAQLFLSRKREYMADAGAVELTKNPEAMISALKKIDKAFTPFDKDPVRKPAYIHYSDKSIWFASHPPIDERIKAIEFFSRIKVDREDTYGQEIRPKAPDNQPAIKKDEMIW